jgi:adenylate kinase
MPDLPGTGGLEAPVGSEPVSASVSELNLILVGPPGAGKGTQAERIQQDFNLPYFATGNILRAAVADGTELGRQAKAFMDEGKLVPDELIIGVLLEALQGADAADGFLLDGFPRTIAQADALGTALEKVGRKITAVLLIDVPDEEVVRRLSGRRTCAKNGHTYHVELDPPKHDGVCDQDGSKLIQRDDDKPEVIKKRLVTYHEQTEPLVDYYEGRDLLRRFDGSRAPTEVHDHIRATIATLRLEDAI